jgi:hypothetical protein
MFEETSSDSRTFALPLWYLIPGVLFAVAGLTAILAVGIRTVLRERRGQRHATDPGQFGGVALLLISICAVLVGAVVWPISVSLIIGVIVRVISRKQK